MTLAENETSGLKLVSESSKNDKEGENNDSNNILGEEKGEKKKFVIVLKKMSPLSKGSQASNEYRVLVKGSDSGIPTSDSTNDVALDKFHSNSSVTKAIEKSPKMKPPKFVGPLSPKFVGPLSPKFVGPLSPKFDGPLSPPASLLYPIVILNDKPQFPTPVEDEAASLPKSSTAASAESAYRSYLGNVFASSPQNELETSAVSNITAMLMEDSTDNQEEQVQPVELTKTMTSLLKFTLNFDHFPSSHSMIKLAKMIKLPWCQVKNWFSYQRQEKRKSGYHLHNNLLKNCPYCQNQQPFINKDQGLEHLYEEGHVQQVIQIEQQNTENESSTFNYSTTIDNAIIKAFGFNSVSEPLRTSQTNIGAAGSEFSQDNVGVATGSLNDNRQFVSQVKRKRSALARKDIPTPEELVLLLKPLQQGWVRKVVYRATVADTVHKKWDVYYRPPVGKQLRSKVETLKHLEKMGIEDLDASNFDFGYKCLGENLENEIICHATASPHPSANRQKKQDEMGNVVPTPPKKKINVVPTPPKKKINVYPPKKKINVVPTHTNTIGNEVPTHPNGIGNMLPTTPRVTKIVAPTRTISMVNKTNLLPYKLVSPSSNSIEKSTELTKSVGAALVARVLGTIKSSNYKDYVIIKHVDYSSTGNNGTENQINDVVGFKTWHTPSWDKQDNKEQNRSSETNQVSGLSPAIEQGQNDNILLSDLLSSNVEKKSDINLELNDHDNISSVANAQTQKSLNNTASERPKIRIKSMLDLQDHSEKASVAENKPFAMKPLSSMFQFDEKNMPAVLDVQEVVIGSAPGSSDVTAINGSKSSSDMCDLNQSMAERILDNIEKNEEIVGKRKRSDTDDDDHSGNMKTKRSEEISKSLADENSSFTRKTDIALPSEGTKTIDSVVTMESSGIQLPNALGLVSSNENGHLVEIPATDIATDVIDNVESLNSDDIRNNNNNNDENNDIIELSDSEDGGDCTVWCEPILISPTTETDSSHKCIDPLQL